MMDLRSDGTIVHSCSGKCVYRNAQAILALRDAPCDAFTKRENPSGTFSLSHQASSLCVNLDAGNKLILSSCNAKYLFEVTQSGKVKFTCKISRNNQQQMEVLLNGFYFKVSLNHPQTKSRTHGEKFLPVLCAAVTEVQSSSSFATLRATNCIA